MIKILIAEDDAAIREANTFLFDIEGVSIYQVKDGKEAVAAMKDANYTLCFMDIDMPVMNGLAAVKQIIKQTPDALIIGVSSNADYYSACIEVDMVDFLAKPINRDSIQSIVSQYVSRPPGNSLIN